MLHRVTNGRLQHEMLVRAAKSDKEGRKAIDATAGMGEDAFLLAAQGYEVTLYEAESCDCHTSKRRTSSCTKASCIEGDCCQDEAGRGQQCGMHEKIAGSCRCDLSGS